MNAQPEPLASSPWLRIAEAADYAKLHKSALLRAARIGQLEHVRIGGRGVVLLKTEWIDRWLETCRVPATDRTTR